jgi:hypothetical protein
MDVKEFEKNLMTNLSRADVDKSFLKSATSTILNLTKKGYEFDRTFWKGKPRPDILVASGKFGDAFSAKDIAGGIRINMDIFPIGVLPDSIQNGVRLKLTSIQ